MNKCYITMRSLKYTQASTLINVSKFEDKQEQGLEWLLVVPSAGLRDPPYKLLRMFFMQITNKAQVLEGGISKRLIGCLNTTLFGTVCKVYEKQRSCGSLSRPY